ncbi:MAG: multicopper oxidase domain-containing protein, partial [Nitriliruptorales bacterium]|nr:multicopper oxidase domain-containing protein [Nitriliruptorales bacterium]
YDTLAANCSVRFDLNAATSSVYSGMTIMHCHILEHEDQGAMTWLDVKGGIGAPTFPGGTPYAELTQWADVLWQAPPRLPNGGGRSLAPRPSAHHHVEGR